MTLNNMSNDDRKVWWCEQNCATRECYHAGAKWFPAVKPSSDTFTFLDGVTVERENDAGFQFDCVDMVGENEFLSRRRNKRRVLRVVAQNVRGNVKSAPEILEFSARKFQLDLFAVSETQLLEADHKYYDGREPSNLGSYFFLDYKRRKTERGSVGFYVHTDLDRYATISSKHSTEHALWLRLRNECGKPDRYFCSIYMPATQHSNAALRDTVWAQLDKAVKYYQRIGVVTLLGDFNCRLKPGMSMADHVSPLGAKLPLRAGRPIVSPSATKMTALLRGCDLLKPNARRNEPNYTWRRTRTDGTVDQLRERLEVLEEIPEFTNRIYRGGSPAMHNGVKKSLSKPPIKAEI